MLTLQEQLTFSIATKTMLRLLNAYAITNDTL